MIKQYISEINSNIPFYCKEKKKFLESLEAEINEYIQNDEVKTFDDLCSIIGDPHIVAIQFMETLSEENKIKFSENRAFITAVIISLLCIISVFLVGIFQNEKSAQKIIHIENVQEEDMDLPIEELMKKYEVRYE